MKEPTKEQKHISMEQYEKNPFVKQRIEDEQKHYYWLGMTAGKHKFNLYNYLQGFSLGFIIGATLMYYA